METSIRRFRIGQRRRMCYTLLLVKFDIQYYGEFTNRIVRDTGSMLLTSPASREAAVILDFATRK